MVIAGVICSAKKFNEMVEQERLHEAVQPAGHANSTAGCGCGYDKNRFSNKRDPSFAVGCIVEPRSGPSKRGRKRRSKTQRAGKIVAISPQTISVHTLLVGPGEDLHVEAPFEQFRLYKGDEAELVERLLSACHGMVNVTSAASFRFRGALVQGPCQLDCGDLILSTIDICAEAPRVRA